MKAGALRSVLQYQTRADTRGAMGQVIPGYTTQYTDRGCVRAPRGTEATLALQVTALVTVMIETRYPGFTYDVSGRLVDVTDASNPKYYNIVSSVDPDNRRRRLVTMATEVVEPVAVDNSNL
jgi:head-tail adaptor